MEKEKIVQIGLDQLRSEAPNIVYQDADVAFHDNLKELPIKGESMKLDIYLIVACIEGKLQVEINTVKYTIGKNHLILCRPNDLVENCMLSPDFEGAVLCLSTRVFLECFSENDLWERAFHFAEDPVIPVSGESLKMYNLYGEMLRTKIKTSQTAFRKEIIISVVRAALYEMLSNIDNRTTCGNGLVRQREVLFKRFIELLASSRVKPRSVTWYAASLCITPKHLSTVCKQVSGRTAFDWIHEYVQIDIRHWLKNSNKTIKEVADQLDFPNISFFGKYCRQHFGVSPTELRKRLREKDGNEG